MVTLEPIPVEFPDMFDQQWFKLNVSDDYRQHVGQILQQHGVSYLKRGTALIFKADSTLFYQNGYCVLYHTDGIRSQQLTDDDKYLYCEGLKSE